MPLDPQIQPVVDAVNTAALERPAIFDQTVEERREAYRALSQLGEPGPALAHVDVLDMDGITARVYSGPNAVGVLVFYHGGGWAIGDLDTHDPLCRQLAKASGAVVISVAYRLAPEHPFPAAVDDAWAALAWVDAHRDDFGPDTKIVVGGDSAGGNLAAVTALWARENDIDLAGQALIYPGVIMADDSPSMTENGEGYILTRESMAWFEAQYAPDPTDWRASPLLADSLADLPPAIVITAGYDPLRDQGQAYARELAEAGGEVELLNYESMPHVFFQLAEMLDAGRDAVERTADFVKKACRGKLVR